MLEGLLLACSETLYSYAHTTLLTYPMGAKNSKSKGSAGVKAPASKTGLMSASRGSPLKSAVASAPGKVLMTGGYLVLDRKHSGLVVGTTARFYTAAAIVPGPCQPGAPEVDGLEVCVCVYVCSRTNGGRGWVGGRCRGLNATPRPLDVLTGSTLSQQKK